VAETQQAFEEVWRRESSRVLGALLRRHGDLADCEDAAQEAAEAAAMQWPREGIPENPRGWLIRVASRRLIDQRRSNLARSVREEAVAVTRAADAHLAPAADEESRQESDDSLRLLFLCCHPSLSRASQVALTLRAVAGLAPAQIAAAYLVPERTMTQRLSRARSALRSAGARFDMPSPEELTTRVAAVLDVCYLMFNEGYTRTAGEALVDISLTTEAISVTRRLRDAIPDHDEVAGALSLMLLTQARTVARTDEQGDLVPLSEQDRALWDRRQIAEGVAMLECVLPHGHIGPFQLQAAIAAVHAEAPSWEDTDWLQIGLLYSMLEQVAPGPAVTLNRAVAVGMTSGPEEGLTLLEPLLADPTMQRHHRTHAVRAHLLEMAGDLTGAIESYEHAARLTSSLPEQRYLNRRLQRISPKRRTR
jgi:RNA polymerase sigma factor (sigma-70 family)